MSLQNIDTTDVILAGAVFGLMAAAVLMLALVWWRRGAKRSQKLQRRLGLSESLPGHSRVLRLWRDGRESTTMVPGKARKRSLTQRLDQLCREAGWEVPGRTVALAALGLSGMAAALTLLFSRNAMMAATAAVSVVLVPWVYVKGRIGRRAAVFERQLVDALQLAARSLRAGHPLIGAFRLIADELDEPISIIFAKICQQQEMGVSLAAAIQQASAESASPDMKLFATSVTIQLRSGGNLADMMDRVAYVIRERIRLGRRVRVLTAQTQFSKRILLGLPLLLFVVLNIVNPGYMETLYATATGKTVLAIAAAGLLLGAYTMNRLAKITW